MLTKVTVLVLAVAIGAAFWWHHSAPPATPGTTEPPAVDFTTEVLSAAEDYIGWDLVEDQANWAPTLCRAPPDPPMARFSGSDDLETHGDKLYFLFAKQLDAYTARLGEQPVGQVLVKESWAAEPAEFDASKPYGQHPFSGQQISTFVHRDGKHFRRGSQRELFAMMKFAPGVPGTDQGWVYATLTPDGKKVTAAGNLTQCASCHQASKEDRMLLTSGS